jgi:hypothetical protein
MGNETTKADALDFKFKGKHSGAVGGREPKAYLIGAGVQCNEECLAQLNHCAHSRQPLEASCDSPSHIH